MFEGLGFILKSLSHVTSLEDYIIKLVSETFQHHILKQSILKLLLL